MAHHSSDGPFGGDPESLEHFRKLLERKELVSAKEELMGATHRHPEPMLGPDDEGELRYRVGVMKDDAGVPKIIIDFGSPVHSLGMTKQQACEMGRLLINRAGYRCTIHLD